MYNYQKKKKKITTEIFAFSCFSQFYLSVLLIRLILICTFWILLFYDKVQYLQEQTQYYVASYIPAAYYLKNKF